MLYVKLFDFVELSFPAVELFISSETKLDELDKILRSKFPEVEEFESCKINNIYSFNIDDLILSLFDW